tara:strand:+ start:1457 stop:1594 length:138 start_codon:yes stop_codon:yes gene_type:complete
LELNKDSKLNGKRQNTFVNIDNGVILFTFNTVGSFVKICDNSGKK